MSSLLKGPVLHVHNLEAIDLFLARLSELQDIAISANREAQLDLEETQEKILRTKLPFMTHTENFP